MRKGPKFAAVVMLSLGMMTVGLCQPVAVTLQSGRVPLKTNGEQFQVVNSETARDVSLAELITFLRSDLIDQIAYREHEYECGEFASALHDSAERAGIRAGLVFLEFASDLGHAANVFRTTDRGIVVVDCTGGIPGDNGAKPGRYDTFGYIKRGSPYGRIQIEISKHRPNAYSAYEDNKAARALILKEKSLLDATREQLAMRWHRLKGDEPRIKTKEAADAHNLEVQKFNEANEKFNRDVVVFNARLAALGGEYDTQKSDLVNFELYW